ncbi:MAG: iron hydrogenase small subunit [Acholeplasmatales bacterium]|nr:iron hydrogenase small subunit [Acholeplasmatales bacterium]
MADLIKVTINGKTVEVPKGSTVMDAAYALGIDIPRLCFLKNINETSACRLCVVEIDGIRTLKNSCKVEATDGMVVRTNTKRVKDAVVNNLKLLAANHNFECWNCPRERNCDFLSLLRRFKINNTIADDPLHERRLHVHNISDSLVIDASKCVLCGRCISACSKLAGTNVLDFNFRGSKTYVGPALNHPIEDSGCIYCGKCIQACPTGALREKDDIERAQDLIDNNDYYTVVQVAPAVRAALGEEFGYPIGTNVEGKLFRALKDLGFNDITDVNFAADVTIMEEGTELLNRIKNGGALPLFTSCSPGWIRYIERYYPEYLPNLSSCKSPQQMQGALIKHYWADKIGVAKDKIKVVSIMPCIAKKSEANRPEMEYKGIRDVDVVLTTRELARWIKIREIDFNNLKDYKPRTPIAAYTGAGVIFGATGGVMEAALRTVYYTLEGKDLEELEIHAVRGVEDIKEATVNIAGIDVNVAVVHGGANIPKMMDMIKNSGKQYHFIEFMGCTGGCVNGGGQPIITATQQDKLDVRSLRAKALYGIDENKELRQSHENLKVQKLYNEFLGKPNSHKAHKLLHTSYDAKKNYNID